MIGAENEAREYLEKNEPREREWQQKRIERETKRQQWRLLHVGNGDSGPMDLAAMQEAYEREREA